MISHTIYEGDGHEWLVFGHDAERPSGLIDTNQIVVRAGDAAMLIDPGSTEVFPSFLAALAETVSIDRIEHIVFSHPDPDVSSSLPLWRQVLKQGVKVYAPAVSTSVMAHLDAGAEFVPLPDEGSEIQLGGVRLQIIPAHYLHAPGNFSVYDSKARVLFSGAIGTAVMPRRANGAFEVESFDAHVPFMESWHRRWMGSPAARDAWLARVSALDVDVLAPQHGPAFRGDMVKRFFDWFQQVDIGTGVAVIGPGARPGAARAPAPRTAAKPQPTAPRPAAQKSAAPAPANRKPKAYQIAIRPTGPEPAKAPQARPAAPAKAPPPAAKAPPPKPAAAAKAPAKTAAAPAAKVPAAKVPAAKAPAAPKPAAAPPPAAKQPAVTPEQILKSGKPYRLVTRSDFDGLACAVLLEDLVIIDDILFVHPKDMQDGNIKVTDADISTNLPYTPGIGYAFDHHLSETYRLGGTRPNHIIDPDAPSAARVVYNYFGGKKAFPKISDEMMAAVDKADSAQFDKEEVLNPKGWELLNFIMDSRTGLGRFRGFRVPNRELMMSLIEYCHAHSIDEILQLPDVKERVDLYLDHREKFAEQLKRCATLHGNLVVLDLREEETIHPGNRFVIYALFPECNISMHIMWGMQKQNTVFAVGKSIFNRTSKTDVGKLMLQYGGGGHRAAGTCQVGNDRAEEVQAELIARMKADG